MTDRTYTNKKFSPPVSHYRQEYQVDVSTQQYMNQVAKVRLLEDQLMGNKFKMDALERRALEFSDIIYNYQQQILSLQESLDRANRQIKLQMAKDAQIQAYEHSLKEVGVQIAALNEALIKKSNDYSKLAANSKKVISENHQLKEQIKAGYEHDEKMKNIVGNMIKLLDENYEVSFQQHSLQNDLKILEENIVDHKTKLLHAKNQLERVRREASETNIHQKEKLIKLQYDLKLAESRSADLDKKKNLENSFALDKNTEKIIQEMLKKQDELLGEIERLQNENEDLKEKLEIQHQSRTHYQKIKNQELQSDLKAAKAQIRDLFEEKDKLEQKLQQISSYSEFYESRSQNQQASLSRKYRQSLEENKRLQMKILELTSDKQMLEKQLRLRYSAKREREFQ